METFGKVLLESLGLDSNFVTGATLTMIPHDLDVLTLHKAIQGSEKVDTSNFVLVPREEHESMRARDRETLKMVSMVIGACHAQMSIEPGMSLEDMSGAVRKELKEYL